MSKQPNRLGRGLSTLISPRNLTPFAASNRESPGDRHERDDTADQLQVPVDRVIPNRHQPRTTFSDDSLRGLADSIRASGVLQPILVRTSADGQFELVAGERRLRAAKLAGLAEVPAIVRDASDAEMLELALIENIQREDLGPLERATAYRRYLDAFQVTPEQLASKLGQSRANVSNYLRLLNLGAEIRDMIASGQLAMGQARAIAGIPDPQRQLAIARLAVRRNLSVRQVEQLASVGDKPGPQDATDSPKAALDGHFTDLARTLTREVGLKVTLQPGRRKNAGRVVLHYNTLDEFDLITQRLGARLKAE